MKERRCEINIPKTPVRGEEEVELLSIRGPEIRKKRFFRGEKGIKRRKRKKVKLKPM